MNDATQRDLGEFDGLATLRAISPSWHFHCYRRTPATWAETADGRVLPGSALAPIWHMPDFRGARVALLEARLREDVAAMVRKLGGEPVSAPALHEAPRPIPDLCTRFVRRMQVASAPVVVCLTGAGLRALFDQAAGQGCDAALTAVLARATTVCRGPKPAGVLASRQLPISVRVEDPFTNSEVLAALEPIDLKNRLVALLHYGELNEPLAVWLRGRGAEVYELMPYEWRLPDDVAPLDRLVNEVIAGTIDAMAFTSQVQVRHLFDVAGSSRTPALIDAMNRRTVIGAIGPTCAAALDAKGVRPTLIARPPKLGPLLTGLAAAMETR